MLATHNSSNDCHFHHFFAVSYYHKVPEELPELTPGQVYGLASPDDYTAPNHHELWTEEVYSAFKVPEQTGEKDDQVSHIYMQ